MFFACKKSPAELDKLKDRNLASYGVHQNGQVYELA